MSGGDSGGLGDSVQAGGTPPSSRTSLIDDPILNSPFHEPVRHFKFDEEGITNEILSGRRPSSHFVPIPRAKKKKGKQLQFDK